MLEAFGKGLRGMTLRYPYEVRDAADYFGDIPDIKTAPDMLKLAEHILDSKAADFDPSQFVDHYENALVEMLKTKQAGRVVPKAAPKTAQRPAGNVIDMLRRSVELESGKSKKVKSPSIQPAARRAASRPKARARA
jgi:DNA end-binding protein Ku